VAKSITVPSLKTVLKDRTLWADGCSAARSNDIESLIKYDYVEQLSPLVEQYNQQVSKAEEIKVKIANQSLLIESTVPEPYKSLDVVAYIADRHTVLMRDKRSNELLAREYRLANELREYENRGLFDVLRTIVYIINTLAETNTVWGVGRGSSVSSYVLYAIGVHDVDSFAYELDIVDFLHD